MSYAGDITPQESWELLSQNPDSVLVDVRTSAEWNWVGRPDLTELGKEVVFVEWNTAEGPNPSFVADLLAAGVTPGDRPGRGGAVPRGRGRRPGLPRARARPGVRLPGVLARPASFCRRLGPGALLATLSLFRQEIVRG